MCAAAHRGAAGGAPRRRDDCPHHDTGIYVAPVGDFGVYMCFVSSQRIPWALRLIISVIHRFFWVAYNAHAFILTVLTLLRFFI
ncbi:hypothetical protein B0H14DRAFT_2967601 [Mycena olivaceomarginata]|nr:hypothetical protein B0H14DRAFT_2967601 [Mycena olivaceomarginata]